MASAAASPKGTCLLEKQLTCSICMDVFQDPVTTACGHTFCKRCLDINCQYRYSECPLCRSLLSNTAAVNIVLRDIIRQRKLEKSEKKNKSIFTGKDGEVACDMCTEQKLQAEKSCLVCLASYCSTHLQNHASTERLKGHKLVAPVKNLDDRACLKHGRPLELYSKKQQRCICVRCLEEGPEEVVSNEDEWEKKKVELENAKTELEAKIQKRETQLDELDKSLKSCKDLLENECWDIEAVFAAVLAIVEEARARALQPLKDRRQVVEKEAENLKQDLEAEISRFQTTISELDDISTLEDHIQFLQNYPSLQELDDIKDWVDVQLDTSLSFGTMRKTTAIMKEKVQQELEKLTSIELGRIPKFTVDVKLDPATAHQRLVLSDDGKEVKDGEEDPEVDDAPERFDMFGSVLGLNGFTSGKSYWEVEVGNKTGWDLGVARGDANRKGKLSLNPGNGYWATVHYDNDKYAALTATPLLLSLLLKPEKVGVFVDYEEDLVSFYNVTAQSHVYSFTGCSFGGELFPYFSPHRKQDDESGDPLIISSVKQCEQIMDES
ncbi:E3 ubiquitin-protein ligase TRIM39-like [Hippoglossus hippoglossus]|uniref:E3 ubiquitin-protein ligase TRIM39-like n=1 Tax=Hippoglossus hippoglossus TaxID=8267 RepID=UPI00148CE247|nr:E3 ubiquitin-protein ligase TRIM39-like [Hippoglossus hippoglossus]